MSLSLCVVGFRDLGRRFQEMLDAKLFCDARHLSYPKEVSDYFGEVLETYDAPTPQELKGIMAEMDIPVREWREEEREGYEIDVADIPPDCKTLRFVASW